MKEKIKENIYKKIEEINGKKKLSCTKAHQIAEELCVSTSEIGKICNQEGIKIYACELGCF